MTKRFGAIHAAVAGAIVALGLLAAPVLAAADPRQVYIDCMGERVMELCTETRPTKPGAEAKPPTFDDVVAACAAERGAFVDMVRARNLAAGRTSAYADRRVARHTRRSEGIVRDVFDQCIETTP